MSMKLLILIAINCSVMTIEFFGLSNSCSGFIVWAISIENNQELFISDFTSYISMLSACKTRTTGLRSMRLVCGARKLTANPFRWFVMTILICWLLEPIALGYTVPLAHYRQWSMSSSGMGSPNIKDCKGALSGSSQSLLSKWSFHRASTKTWPRFSEPKYQSTYDLFISAVDHLAH